MKIIVCFDLDCFYAQVAEQQDPSLKGKPVIVRQKYVAVTANYEARKYGIGKLETVKEALRKCPQAIVVDGSDLEHFRRASKRINKFWFDKLKKYGEPLMEKKGFDEAFLDLTQAVLSEDANNQKIQSIGKVIGDYDPMNSVHARLGRVSQIAHEWRKELFEEYGYKCCAGIGYGKISAKAAVNLNKPNNQALILPEALSDFLTNKPVHYIQGIGRKLAKQISMAFEIKFPVEVDKNITCGEARKLSLTFLCEYLKDVNKASFAYNAVRGTDYDKLRNSDMKLKTISVDDTTLPHPKTLEECLPKIRMIVQKLQKLLTTRLKEERELPTLIKYTVCHKFLTHGKNIGRKSYSWKVHSKQEKLVYTPSDKGCLQDGSFPKKMLFSLSKKLLASILETYFLEVDKLFITRMNIGVSGFVSSRDIKQSIPKRGIRSMFESRSIGLAKRPKVEVVDLVTVDDQIDRSNVPPGMNKEVFMSLPMAIKEEILSNTVAFERPLTTKSKMFSKRKRSIESYLKKK